MGANRDTYVNAGGVICSGVWVKFRNEMITEWNHHLGAETHVFGQKATGKLLPVGATTATNACTSAKATKTKLNNANETITTV